MLTLPRFRVYTSETDSVDLVVIPADRMRAERASTTELPPSQRGPGAAKTNAETWLMLWLWCSATRAGLTADKFTDWSLSVLDYDRLDAEGNVIGKSAKTDDDAELEGDEAVDPTQTGASTS